MTQPAVTIKPFNELTLGELHACLKLRGEVFVVGQQICAVPDVDEHDPACWHAMLWQGGELVGTARLKPMADGHVIKVGRVAVGRAHRGQGLGRVLMRAVQGWIDGRSGGSGLMHAQAHLERWYAGLGWERVGEGFIEAGIEHVSMRYAGPKPQSTGAN